MSPPSDPASPPPPPTTASAKAVEASLAFWAEAGVSVAATEAPVDRLALPPSKPKPSPTSQPLAPSPAPANAKGPSEAATGETQPAGLDLARSAGDLAALAEAIAAFDGCALRHAGASRPVIWRGDPATADVLVIGEAPTAADDASGQAFQGAEGRLMDRMLQAAGLSERTLLVNTVFWRTPGGAVPALADQAACRPFLERAAALLQPKAVLIVGAAAARGVLGASEPILKLRGRWTTWAGVDEPLALPALPTFSPAFLLAQPLARKRAWADVLTLAARVDAAPGAP